MKKLSPGCEEFDVALSFAGEDRQYVEKVAILLKSRGINVFYDKFRESTLWGKNLIEHLGKIYAERSRFIVMFISKHYAEKTWTNHERKFAQERAFMLKEDCILPARFDDTSIPGLSSTVGFVDLRKTSPKELANLIVIKLTDSCEEITSQQSAKISNNQNNGSAEDNFGDEIENNKILFAEASTLKPDTHKCFTCVLKKNETIKYDIESNRFIDIMILDNEDYKEWKDHARINTYYEHFEDCLNVAASFTAPEDDEYLIVIVNYGKSKTKIQINTINVTE